MTGFSFSSLRVRLVLLVLFAVIPALGTILYTAWKERLHATAEAEERALKLARNAVTEQSRLISETRQFLGQVAQEHYWGLTDPVSCSALMTNHLKQHPKYLNLGVINLKGDLLCSALPLKAPINVADRTYFRRTVETQDFSIGEYQTGRVTGKATVNFGFPDFDDKGRFEAVVFAALDLTVLEQAFVKAKRDEGSVFLMLDQTGTVLSRYPAPEKGVGKPFQDPSILKAIQAKQDEIKGQATGVDDIERLYAFSALRLGGEIASFIGIGIPVKVAFAEAQRNLLNNFVLIGLLSVLVLAATWFGGDLFILRQVNDLVDVTKRLGSGDLSSRTRLPYDEGELGQLGRAFDQMAEKIQRQLGRITALREINLATTSTLDLHAVLNVLMEKIDLFLPYTAVLVWLKNRESGQLERAACWNLDEEDWKGRPLNRTPLLVQAAIESKASVVASNVQTDPRTLDPELYRRHGLVSYLGVPLVVKDEALGVLVFLTREEHQFTEQEIEFLSTLAGQAAIAIHNSRLYEQTLASRKELELTNQRLARLLGEISSLYAALTPLAPADSLDQLLEKIVYRLMEATGADAALIRLQDNISGTYPCATQRGFPDYYLETVVNAPPGGAATWVFQNAQPIIASDIAAEPRLKGKIQLQVGFRSCAMLPLMVQNEVRGIIHLASRELGYFSEGQRDHLMAIARQMGIALENRDLFDEMSAAKSALEKANKVKDEFLGFVSHELKTPVNAVLGYAEMIQERLFGEINPEQVRALGKVIGCSRDLINMINSLLQATQIEAGLIKVEREEVALANLLDDLRSIYSVPLGKELTLNWDYPSEFPAIKTDREKLKHVLQNLISNAIKYTDKGNVSISARWLPEAKVVEFRVADTGIGIPGESLPFVFEMFRQVEGSKNGSRGGVGLGLHIVKKFTNLLGGKIDVESEPGRGSTFTVTIPCGHEATGERQ